MSLITIREIAVEDCWPIRHQVMWPDKDLEYVKLPLDSEGIHLGLFLESRLISVISLFIHGQHGQFRKFATLQQEQGKGYGSQLLTYSLAEFEKRKVSRVWCNARVERAEYYEKFGLKKTSESFSKGGRLYVVMEMK